jgi:hypothetical protein
MSEDTIDVVMEIDAPPLELEKDFMDGFAEVARRHRAVGVRVFESEDNKMWKCVTRFSNDAAGKKHSLAFIEAVESQLRKGANA